ncbi:hypothetical protein MKEN_01330200 [Mycena kentingensis (nom. inval.)]|nr:hypothetical protein MKEN_01330200 [Mycena kentingensis (nom. inval.)]
MDTRILRRAESASSAMIPVPAPAPAAPSRTTAIQAAVIGTSLLILFLSAVLYLCYKNRRRRVDADGQRELVGKFLEDEVYFPEDASADAEKIQGLGPRLTPDPFPFRKQLPVVVVPKRPKRAASKTGLGRGRAPGMHESRNFRFSATTNITMGSGAIRTVLPPYSELDDLPLYATRIA